MRGIEARLDQVTSLFSHSFHVNQTNTRTVHNHNHIAPLPPIWWSLPVLTTQSRNYRVLRLRVAHTMPPFSLRPATLFLVIFLLCAPLHAFAVPWATSALNPTQQAAREQQPSYRLRNVFPQLTWLRDSAIEKVFGLAPKTSKPVSDKSHQTATSKLPTKLLAKYGGEVVLRFNLTTAAEEHALAEAANTLFLDVWEFTNNWADIRLREDDVSNDDGINKSWDPD